MKLLRKQLTSFIVPCILGLAFVGAAALIFPDAALEHSAAFILAGVLVVVLSAAMALLNIAPLDESRKQLEETAALLRQERKMYRDALLHDCDYAYVVNVNENRLHDVYKGEFLKQYSFDFDAPYDEAMSRTVEHMKPVLLNNAAQLHLCAHYAAAYEQGKRVVESEYYIPGSDAYKRKTVFLSVDEQGVTYAFVVNHDITAKRKEELEITKSLTQLAEAAEKVGSGDLNVEINVDAPGLVGILADVLSQTILHLKWHIDQLNQQARRDAMTGVKNKRAWQDDEKRLNRDIQAGKAQFAVVVCDLNGLKQANDNYGHEAGDRLIVKACRIICNTFKRSPVYRIGGDEFAVTLEGADLSNCGDLLHTLRSSMAAQEPGAPSDPPASIAFGISHYQPGDTAFSDVFHRADAAMYENKSAMKAESGR